MYRKHPRKQETPPISDGNYVRSSQLFESGFTGFRGLTITSTVWVGKFIIICCFLFQAFRRCVTHRRKEGYKVILYKLPLRLKRRRTLSSVKSSNP